MTLPVTDEPSRPGADERVARDPAAAHHRLGPLDRAPILYACFLRLARVEPGRAPGVRAAVATMLADLGVELG